VPGASVVPLLAVSLVAGVSVAGVVPVVVALSLLATGGVGLVAVTVIKLTPSPKSEL
jgi:hypothetical protein